MSYVPDPSDDSEPLGTRKAKTAAEEFRGIKRFITKIPQTNVSADRTFSLVDAGYRLYHPDADVTSRTWTIPTNAAVAFAEGTVISIINGAGAGDILLTPAIGVTLRRLGTDGEGARTIPANAGGHLELVDAAGDVWYFSGTGDS